MRKLKLLIAGLLICSGLYASQKEDIKFLDQLFIQKKYSMALQESNRFIEKYPNSKYLKNIIIRMGQVYYMNGDYSNSIRVLNKALNLKKLKEDDKNTIYLYLAKSYAGKKEYNSAKKIAGMVNRSTVDGKDTYEDILLSIGRGYLDNGDYLRAQSQLNEALLLQGSRYNEIVLNLALAAYNNSQYIKTTVYLDEFYRGGGKSNEGLVNYLYGSSYYKINENTKALEYFNKLIKSPENSEYKSLATLTSIEIYLKQENIEKAKSILLSLKNNSKLYNEALKSFGDYFLVKNNNKEALDYYSQITSKNNSEVIYGIALSEYKLKNYDTALVSFRKLFTTKYKKESIYYQMLIEYQRKNYSWILENINLVNGINYLPAERIAINNLIGTSAFEKGDFIKAKEFYKKNYDMSPTKENLYKLIVATSKLKNNKDIYSYIKEYNNMYPTDQEYRKNITMILANEYIGDKKSEEAVELYKNYLETNRDTDIISNLIDVLIAQKDYNDVLEYLNIQDSSEENTYLKGIATMGMGKYDEAEIYFNQITKDDSKAGKALKEKAKYNSIRNYFLWEKYPDVVNYGEKYIQSDSLFGLEDVVDKVAISYFRMDNPEKAREYFDKLKLVSNMGDYAQFQIGETYYSEKDYLKAIENYHISATTAKDPKYRENGAYWEISSLYLMKNIPEFTTKSNEFIKEYPNSSLKDNVFLMEGELYGINGDYENSIATYEKLYNETLDKDLKEKSLMKIIDLNQSNKNFEKELEWIEKITTDNKKTYYTARYLIRKNEPEKAKIQLEKLLLTDDYKDFAGVSLGDYYLNKKDYLLAEKNYNIAIQMESSAYKDKALYEVANIQRDSDQLKDAIRNYTKLYVLYPQSKYSLESQIRIAESYEKLKEYKEASAQYEELLKSKSTNKDYFLEKLIFLNLKLKKVEKAKEYYLKLQEADPKLSEKYKNFFNGGDKE